MLYHKVKLQPNDRQLNWSNLPKQSKHYIQEARTPDNVKKVKK